MEDTKDGGLLGFLNTPAGMGLLGTVFGGLATAKRGQPLNSLGKAGLAGAVAYGYGANRDEKARQAAMVTKQAADNMAALRNAFSPVSGGRAMSDGMGPTNANALLIGKPPSAFNPGDFLAKNPNANLPGLTQAMDIHKFMQPDAVAQKNIDPNKPFTLGPNGEIVANKPYQDYLASLEELRAKNMRPPAQPMSPVAYVDPVTGKSIWGTITDARGKQASNFSPATQGALASAKALGGETGQQTGESVAKLQDMESMMPRLETVTAELSDLGKKATYTLVGQGANFARRQLGMGVGEGAIARKEYISKVDNEILPLLRQTFGAQFTQKEGESLKATLGDTNASPAEKDAVLKSFIETKYGQIAGLKRRTGDKTTGKTVVKTGIYKGKKVNQYSDGSADYAN